MRNLVGRAALLAWAATLSGEVWAQSNSRLPIPEGVWVDVATQCGSATQTYVHGGGRFGHIYFFGPNASMGPSDETEAVTATGRGTNGYTVVNDSSIEVRPLANGRIAVRAYSRAQGEIWVETMRACPVETLSPRMREAVARHVRAPATVPAAAAPGTPSGPQARWQVARVSEGGIAAYVNGTPALPALIFRCDRGAATIAFNTPGDYATGPRQFAFSGARDERRVIITFVRDARSAGAWVARPDAAIRALFSGAEPVVLVRTEGRSIATLSLDGAGAAIGQALADCPATAAAPTPATPQTAAPVAPLGVAPGYYVEEGQPCRSPTGGVFFYDGRRYGMMYPPDTGPDVVGPIGRPTRRGNAWVLNDGSQVLVLSPTRLRWAYEEMGPPRRLCAAAEIPAGARVR